MLMDDRVRLKVIGLSYNQLQSGAFALLLGEEKGPLRIPVVIGAAEAQSIAIYIESVKPPRPLTHDLFTSFAQAFGIRLREVFIYRFENGVFYSELTFDDGERQIAIDARTSDAIAIAMRCHAPIWTTKAIIEETGFVIDSDPTVDPEYSQSSQSDTASGDEDLPGDMEIDPHRLALEELEKMLARLIEEENYEEAGRISKIIAEKKNK